MIPGQLGPTNRVLFCVFKISVMRTMSAMTLDQVPIALDKPRARTMLRDTFSNAIELLVRSHRAERNGIGDRPDNKGDLSCDGLFNTRSGQRWARLL